MAVFLKVANKPCSIKPWKYSHRLIQIRIISLKIKNKDFFFSKKKKRTRLCPWRKNPYTARWLLELQAKENKEKK